ncbi:MAG: lipoyl(octanoyl) transferase LipB [Chryseolinea sp.]
MNFIKNNKVQFVNLGLIGYKDAWEYQTSLFDRTLAIKTKNRSLSEDRQQITDNHLLFCEHPHVFTLGKSGKENNLLVDQAALSAIEATYHRINRGGDITYHGPGQVVGYPILDLENFFTDIHKYMRYLEQVIIETLGEFSIEAGRIKGLTGVWLDIDSPLKARKICAFGVRASRWVTMHGFALNVNTDLQYFGHIVPCGINDKAVTSINKELGKFVELPLVEEILKDKFVKVFEVALEALVREKA